jgi:hypothetical protein
LSTTSTRNAAADYFRSSLTCRTSAYPLASGTNPLRDFLGRHGSHRLRVRARQTGRTVLLATTTLAQTFLGFAGAGKQHTRFAGRLASDKAGTVGGKQHKERRKNEHDSVESTAARLLQPSSKKKQILD